MYLEEEVGQVEEWRPHQRITKLVDYTLKQLSSRMMASRVQKNPKRGILMENSVLAESREANGKESMNGGHLSDAHGQYVSFKAVVTLLLTFILYPSNESQLTGGCMTDEHSHIELVL